MKRLEIFEQAVKDYKGGLENKESELGKIAVIVNSIDQEKLTEIEKFEKLGTVLDVISHSNKKRIYGLKVLELKEVIRLIFNVNNKKIKNPFLEKLAQEVDFDFTNLYYYYKVIERLAKSNIDLRSQLIEAEREKIRLMEQMKEEEKKREEEKKQQFLEELSEIDRKIYTLKESKDESIITQYYQELDNYSGEDKVKLAKALKEIWQNNNKWEGNISKKQKVKVARIKEILGES